MHRQQRFNRLVIELTFSRITGTFGVADVDPSAISSIAFFTIATSSSRSNLTAVVISLQEKLNGVSIRFTLIASCGQK